MDLADSTGTFLAQPAPLPETLINGAPEFFLKRMLGSWAGEDDQTVFTEAAMAEYLAAAQRPGDGAQLVRRIIARARASTCDWIAPIDPRARRSPVLCS